MFADPDPGSQNVEDPKLPKPLHSIKCFNIQLNVTTFNKMSQHSIKCLNIQLNVSTFN